MVIDLLSIYYSYIYILLTRGALTIPGLKRLKLTKRTLKNT